MTSVEDTADHLRNTILRLYRQLRWQTQSVGMAAQDPILIETIRLNPGITVSELASREHMRPPAMTEHVQRLEKAGFIRREQDNPADRRRIGLYPTRKGLLALNRAKKTRTDWLVQRLEGLSAEDLAAVTLAITALEQIHDETAA